jgi:hypothetical protein
VSLPSRSLLQSLDHGLSSAAAAFPASMKVWSTGHSLDPTVEQSLT